MATAYPLMVTDSLRGAEITPNDTIQRTSGLRQKQDPVNRSVRELKTEGKRRNDVISNQTEEVRHQRTEQIRAAQKRQRPDTLRKIERSAKGELKSGGLLVNELS